MVTQKPHRNGLNSPKVLGNILTCEAIASGGTRSKFTVKVNKFNCQAVNLDLHNVINIIDSKKLFNAPVELCYLIKLHSILKA